MIDHTQDIYIQKIERSRNIILKIQNLNKKYNKKILSYNKIKNRKIVIKNIQNLCTLHHTLKKILIHQN